MKQFRVSRGLEDGLSVIFEADYATNLSMEEFAEAIIAFLDKYDDNCTKDELRRRIATFLWHRQRDKAA